jgi:DNA (cytosine-5)-methyltransferase 1
VGNTVDVIKHKITRTPTQKATALISEEYGDPLLHNIADPVGELIFILLSEKTDESKYLPVFEELRARYPRWGGLLKARTKDVERIVKAAGMGKRRADLIKRLLRAIVDESGDLDLSSLAAYGPAEAEKALTRLPGVGPKAARCVLMYCFDMPVLPVDIHTYRLAVRLGIIPRTVSYAASHDVLQERIPEALRRRFHVNAVAHGRARCFARNPVCKGCPVRRYCLHIKSVKPLPITVRPKPVAIDLFAGAGGLSLGFSKAGFQIAQAIERDPHAAKTYRRNHPDVDVLEADIGSVDPRACLKRLGLRPGDVSAVIGGPPCQGFSTSNRRTRNSANPKNGLYEEFFRFVRLIEPAWFVLENVSGMKEFEGGYVINEIDATCERMGYRSTWTVLNAVEYGVPQIRRRIFVVGNRLGVPFEFPPPTHGPGLEKPITVGRAISDLPVLGNGASTDYLRYRRSGCQLTVYQRTMQSDNGANGQVQGNLVSLNNALVLKRYRYIGPGENWEAIPRRLIKNYQNPSLCHTGIYHRLEWARPAKVIGNFRKNMLIHPRRDRGLSVREAARLQSFPDSYVFLGSIGFQQQQVADAVPPLLAEAVAGSVLRAIRSA